MATGMLGVLVYFTAYEKPLHLDLKSNDLVADFKRYLDGERFPAREYPTVLGRVVMDFRDVRAVVVQLDGLKPA